PHSVADMQVAVTDPGGGHPNPNFARPWWVQLQRLDPHWNPRPVQHGSSDRGCFTHPGSIAGPLLSDHHGADHPVGLVARQMTDERLRPNGWERDGRPAERPGRDRDLRRTGVVDRLRAGSVALVGGGVTDDPFM